MSLGYGGTGRGKLNENTIFPENYDYDDINEGICEDTSFITNFSGVIVDGLIESEGNNNKCQNNKETTDISNTTCAPPAPLRIIQGLPQTLFQCVNDNSKSEIEDSSSNKKASGHSLFLLSGANGILIDRNCQRDSSSTTDIFSSPNCTNFFQPKQPLFQISPKTSCHSSLEGTSLESAASTVSFVTQIEIKAKFNEYGEQSFELQSEEPSLTMEDSVEESSEAVKRETPPSAEGTAEPIETDSGTKEDDGGKGDGDDGATTPTMEDEKQQSDKTSAEESSHSTPVEERNESLKEEDNESESTVSESCESEAIVDDIELILMPEMCGTLPPQNVSPKLVRVTELKMNMDDVFEDDDDQSNRHVFHSIVDEYEEEEQGEAETPQEEHAYSRLSVGEDDVSSCSELLEGDNRVKGASFAEGETSKRSSSGSSGRRRRSTSGRISSAVQTEITAVEEPSALAGHHGFRKKTSGKSSSARLGIPGGGSGKKLNWKSEINLLPSKMKVKQAGFNSFESNDERDQYSPRVAKFTSQDTLNLSSQFLKPSTLYRTRNLSRNLNQFASSESTFMLPMSSEQQLSAESPRFRDRVSSSTSGGAAGNFKGVTPSHSYSASAYQISSMLTGAGAPISSRRQPLSHTTGFSGGSMIRHFRSSMPDLNAVNKSYPAGAANMADTHRRRPPSKSKKYHHSSSSGYRLQKRSSSDEETSSLIDESERCLRSSIDLLLTDELPSPGRESCLRSGFGSSLAAISTGFYSSRRFCSQPNLNDQAYPPDMKDPTMGSPFLPRRLRDMRCSRFAKVILPNGIVAVVAVKEIDEINETLTVQSADGVFNLPFRKVVFAWKTKR